MNPVEEKFKSAYIEDKCNTPTHSQFFIKYAIPLPFRSKSYIVRATLTIKVEFQLSL